MVGWLGIDGGWKKDMIRYTTPTISLTVEGVDISACDIYVSLKQDCQQMTLTNDDLTVEAVASGDDTYDTNISFDLSQEESAKFCPESNISMQVNWIDDDGKRGATDIKPIRVEQNLLREVITHGDD